MLVRSDHRIILEDELPNRASKNLLEEVRSLITEKKSIEQSSGPNTADSQDDDEYFFFNIHVDCKNTNEKILLQTRVLTPPPLPII